MIQLCNLLSMLTFHFCSICILKNSYQLMCLCYKSACRPSSAFTGTYCYHRYCTGMPRKHEFYICSKAHLVACSLDASLVLGRRCFNTSSVLTDIFRNTEFDDTEAPVKMQDEEWDRFNTVVYPPMEEGQPVRPAV